MPIPVANSKDQESQCNNYTHVTTTEKDNSRLHFQCTYNQDSYLFLLNLYSSKENENLKRAKHV